MQFGDHLDTFGTKFTKNDNMYKDKLETENWHLLTQKYVKHKRKQVINF